MTTRYELVTVSSGSSLFLSYLLGDGSPRLFEGDGIYVFGLNRALWKSSDAGNTFSNVLNSNTVMAMCQTSETPAKTVTFVSSGSTSGKTGKYQSPPESVTGWVATGSLPANFSPLDAVADVSQNIGILVGNAHRGTETRIIKSPQSSPYSFSDSDTGIPQSPGTPTASIPYITDLELVE